MATMKIQAGDRLWFVPSQRCFGEPMFVNVEKCGRKWITLDNGRRVAVESLVAEGGGYMSPGLCFLDKESWQAEQTLMAAWDAFRKTVYVTQRPTGLTIEQLEQVRAQLAL